MRSRYCTILYRDLDTVRYVTGYIDRYMSEKQARYAYDTLTIHRGRYTSRCVYRPSSGLSRYTHDTPWPIHIETCVSAQFGAVTIHTDTYTIRLDAIRPACPLPSENAECVSAVYLVPYRACIAMVARERTLDDTLTIHTRYVPDAATIHPDGSMPRYSAVQYDTLTDTFAILTRYLRGALSPIRARYTYDTLPIRCDTHTIL